MWSEYLLAADPMPVPRRRNIAAGLMSGANG